MANTLSRTKFAGGAAAAFAGIAIVKAPAKAAQFQYKYASNVPISHPLNVRMIEMWKDVERLTKGRSRSVRRANLMCRMFWPSPSMTPFGSGIVAPRGKPRFTCLAFVAM